MDKYLKLRTQSEKQGERNDCTVIATALSARMSYKEAHELIESLGRKPRKGFYTSVIINALDRRGYKIKHYNPVQRNGCKFTNKTIGKAFKRGYFICKNKGHAFALINGEVQDWSTNKAKRVIDVWQITKPKGV